MKKTWGQILEAIGVLFAIHLVNWLSEGALNQFGILPRTVIGLRGILFSPLIHGSWGHLLANAAPLGILLGLLALSKTRPLWPTTAQIWVISGAAVWLVGRPNTMHIGASGLIYGLVVYLLAAAWFTRNLRAAIAALSVLFFVLFLYDGIFWGVLPGQSGISWEGHLCGALTGFLVAARPRWLSAGAGNARSRAR